MAGKVALKESPMRLRSCLQSAALVRDRALLSCLVLMLATAICLRAQSGIAATDSTQAKSASSLGGLSAMLGSGALSEDAIEHALKGKTLYLRGGLLDNTLEFDETGQLQSDSLHGSFTLALVRIDKVRLSKKRLELDGIRYGLHFRGELATEDLKSNTDQVRITPKKKSLKITIARQQVVKPKKKRKKKDSEQKETVQASGKTPASGPSEIPEDEEKTVSQEQADQLLRAALDRIFAPGIDERLVKAMPAAWQGFFESAQSPLSASGPVAGALSQDAVDAQARLTAPVEPSSNDFAQKAGIAGMALYHVVVDAGGKANRISVVRPIGFGLDENAVKAIELAKFHPAMKNGLPVPAEVDVVVQFRIYSKRTSVLAPKEEDAGAQKPILPGPYSVPHS